MEINSYALQVKVNKQLETVNIESAATNSLMDLQNALRQKFGSGIYVEIISTVPDLKHAKCRAMRIVSAILRRNGTLTLKL